MKNTHTHTKTNIISLKSRRVKLFIKHIVQKKLCAHNNNSYMIMTMTMMMIMMTHSPYQRRKNKELIMKIERGNDTAATDDSRRIFYVWNWNAWNTITKQIQWHYDEKWWRWGRRMVCGYQIYLFLFSLVYIHTHMYLHRVNKNAYVERIHM